MADQTAKYLVTGASGQLGALVVAELVGKVPAKNVVALVRRPDAAAALEAHGVEVRIGDYDDRASLEQAFQGIDRMLLISASEMGRRAEQHKNAVDAAVAAGVGFLAYTSVLRAETNSIGLAADHRETEAAIKASGLPHAFLRHGWYTENQTASIPPALEHGAYLGAAGDGLFSSATRQDYAEGDVAVLAADTLQSGAIYELAGDESYTMAEFVEVISSAAGKPVAYVDMSEAEFAGALESAGLPAPIAALLADSDANAAKGALKDESHTLQKLIGRPTTPWAETVRAAVKAL
ncbi:SDR family oxidoreductase [Hoeflea sp. EC-HK425]|jgi:NAD(P)H dehydrogenase (quinone)|uniref:SDR family oxidoreductase n=1 Tax=Hoeflea sp. EC-HK425 TaxID=2038388 RepID=UPI0012571885|nr:SDR family oxidoreductase [Hoeflea sp. EC-HK425]VVS96109.1 NAD(P)H:quinone oxidoreductase [Hoeflea sp. EC-HK425]